MLRVAFAGGFAATFAPLVRPSLKIPCEIVVVADEAEAAGSLGDIDVLVTLAFTPAMGAAAGSRLKLVQLPAAGLDRIDRAALPAGVALANAYGHEAGIAEYIMGAMVALTRDFRALDAGLRAGDWPGQWAPGRPRSPLSPELAGATLGILGHGHIGAALAPRARAFDMEVVAIRRDTARGAGGGATLLGGLDRLDELLRASDYLAITLSLNERTRGLIGARELALMKPGARLVNVARAEIVDEAALFDALSSGRLAGAALDVWYRYPRDDRPTAPAALPFHTLPNVLMTPHVSGATEGMAAARAAVVASNIERIARGERPINEVTTP
ncbi:MAG: phosphoglycerate dehydrogenase [Rhodospirillales bacterium]|nr:MAG: phosphoglycerate dehydrogenase [Rhodospirillales bacterium]